MREHRWEPIPGTLQVSVNGGEAMTVNPQRCLRCGSVSLIEVSDRVLASFETGPWRKVSDDCDFDLVRNVMES